MQYGKENWLMHCIPESWRLLALLGDHGEIRLLQNSDAALSMGVRLHWEQTHKRPPGLPNTKGLWLCSPPWVREIPNWNQWQVSSGAGGKELGLLGGQASNTGIRKEKVSLLRKKKSYWWWCSFLPKHQHVRNSEDSFQTGTRPSRMLVFSGHLLFSTQGRAKQNLKKSSFVSI